LHATFIVYTIISDWDLKTTLQDQKTHIKISHFFVDSNIGSSPQNLHGHNLKKKRSPLKAIMGFSLLQNVGAIH